MEGTRPDEPAPGRMVIREEDSGLRLDIFLARKAIVPSRAYAQKLILENGVEVNGTPAKPSYRVKQGDEVVAVIPGPVPLEVQPEEIPLDILYEDSDIVVVNKPRGMVVHPAAGNWSSTLVNALLAHCKDLSGIGGTVRPGIVHRLDKDTSGILVAAKNDLAHLSLASQIKDHTVKRKYVALVHGNVKQDSGTVDAPIGRHPTQRKKMAVLPGRGKPAITHFKVLERFGDYTLIEAQLETGRTHQIRVHMAHLGHPVVGDPVYGGRHGTKVKAGERGTKTGGGRGLAATVNTREAIAGLRGQALHAFLLGFTHPRTGKHMEFSAPVPEDIERVVAFFRRRFGVNESKKTKPSPIDSQDAH